MKMKQLTAGMIALVMSMSLPMTTYAYDWYLEDGSITVDAGDSGQTVTQGSTSTQDEAPVVTQRDSSAETSNTITINASENATANVTISNVNINASNNAGSESKAAVSTGGKGNVNIELDGTNTLKSGSEHAGLEKGKDGKLTITDKNENGKLSAIGGYSGAGIGGGDQGNGSNIIITGGEITVYASPEHLAAPLAALRRMGCRITTGEQSITLTAPEHLQGAGSIVTLPYPGFPTDLQAIFMALAAAAEGYTAFTETVFPRRWAHVEELRRLGADITVVGSHAVIRGAPLIGSALTCTDLRAGAAVVLAALAAKGESSVTAISHIERGYADFVSTLRHLGADIYLTEV